MTEIGRRIGQSGVYALLATAFVLACSLMVASEEPDRQASLRPDAAQLSSFAGSGDRDLPDPGAGQ